MTDKELLEMAAKAAGLVVVDRSHPVSLYIQSDGCHGGVRWNPLTDDGDALRLAADLRLKVLPGRLPGDGCTVESQRQGIAGCTTFRDDKREQMRRAIVHVAAEIGKAMP